MKMKGSFAASTVVVLLLLANCCSAESLVKGRSSSRASRRITQATLDSDDEIRESSSTQEQPTDAAAAAAAVQREKSSTHANNTILAVVCAYKEDISWILAEDRGGDKFLTYLPTELYQVADINSDDCRPTWPGLPADASIAPQLNWPTWAQKWPEEKCSVQRRGITPASVEDSVRMAEIDAGLSDPLPALRHPLGEDVVGKGVVHYDRLSPLQLHILPNKGAEALAYVTAIISHYDDLPELMLFMHGHRKSWHTFEWGQDFALSRIALLPPRNLTHGFMQLGCIELEDHANKVFPNVIGANHWSPAATGTRWHESFAAHFLQAWAEHFSEAFGSKNERPPIYIQAAPGASFAVTRGAILRHSKEFYEGLRQWMLETPMERYWVGNLFSFLFHYMFTGLEVFDPPRTQCLCELYDICIGGAKA